MKRKFLSILFALVLALSLCLVTAAPASAATYYVGAGQTYTTIQAAVNAALAGDTIIVAAGTYDEQVVINKSLTLQGVGDTTIIKPSSATTLITVLGGVFSGATKQIAGIIVANVADGSSVTIKNLQVDESAVTAKPTTTPATDYLAGIFYRETGGVVDTVSIVGTGAWSGTDRAYGMYVSAIANTVSVEVKGCTITNYDKNGIDAHGNKLTANIHHNTITGRGLVLVGDEVQNGVNVMDWAVGTVNSNTISNMDASTTSWGAAGILFFHNGGTANGNTITNCNYGIIFQDGSATAEGNTINGGAVGVRGINWQNNVGFTGPLFTVSFKGNTISGIRDYTIGTTLYNGYAIAAIAATDFNCTLTVDSNQLMGGGATTGDGVFVGGYDSGTVVATITNNTISGWEYGMRLRRFVAAGSTIVGNTIKDNTNTGIWLAETGVVATNLKVNANNIFGNLLGVNNLSTGSLNAESNWWGTTVSSEIQAKVVGNVNFTPWLNSPITAGAGEVTMTAIFIPRIGISVTPTSVSFGGVVPGVASTSQTVTVTNTGNVAEKFSASLRNMSTPDVYTTGLKISTYTVSVWSALNVAIAGFISPGLILTVPLGTAPGTYTAALIFWAEMN